MAGMHGALLLRANPFETKLCAESCHNSVMRNSPLSRAVSLCPRPVIWRFCGLRMSVRKQIGEAGGPINGAGGEQVMNRGAPLCCVCIQGKDISGNYPGLKSGIRRYSAPPGVLSGLENEIRGVYVYTVRSKAFGGINARGMRLQATLGGDGDVDLAGDVIAEDFYSVLGLTPDASPEEIKKAYYSCMKACHPDLSGNDSAVNNFCMFINEVYEVLSDPEQRLIYDEINGYTLTAINPFRDFSAERDHAFVDEFACIGCKNCAHTAPATFDIEEDFGRARVISQVGNPVLIQMAIETCPVDCIHWTSAQQLTLLEDEMRRVERVNVGLMLSGMGSSAPDVFTQASWRWEKRQAKAVERARVRMMKEGGKSGKEAWWNVNWGSAADEKSSKAAADKYARERAAKTAAAARRWREYSRKGVDRRAIRILAAENAAQAQDDLDKEKAEIM